MKQLLDVRGNPIQRQSLTQEVAGARIGSVRSPMSGYPADGLNPLRLASILREADGGDPVRYLELAETIEERDPHYLGVLGTRRRSVCQIEMTVDAASEDARDVEIAEMIRDWLDRDELAEEMFDILDCIGKGYSFTEIIWDASEGQFMPERLEWRDPRWFRFHRDDLATPLMLGDHGEELPLPGMKFIFATIKAKSGIALRSGLARVAAWGWMFKAFTQRDWAIFTQTYGQPLRVGKYGAGATEEEKNKLFSAVANIAGDCAAIIPESMLIEFVETSSVGATSDLYKTRADWLDQQISKAVLGQTATTDAVTGGLGSGKEHRQVQEDIERADARALAAILNRDLIRPWVELNYGPQKRYPRLRIERAEQEDLELLASSLEKLVPLGLDVDAQEVRDRFGLSEPKAGAKLLVKPAAPAPVPPEPGAGDDAVPPKGADKAKAKAAVPPALQAQQHDHEAPTDRQADVLARAAAPEMGRMVDQIEAMLAAATSLEEFKAMLEGAFEGLDSAGLAGQLGNAMIAAHALGRTEAAADSEPVGSA